MDQTTLNRFFVTRKSSISATIPPAKRVKLNVTKIEKEDGKNGDVQIKPTGRSKTKNANTRKGKKSRNIDNCYFGVNGLFSAKPIQVTNKSLGDTSITPKVKTPEKTRSNLSIKNDDEVVIAVIANKSESILSIDKEKVNKKSCGTHVKENDRKCNELPFNDEINDQAKTILFSRGSTMLRAGFENNMCKSPSKASEVLNCLSPKKNYDSSRKLTITGSPSKMQLKSPTKLSEILNTLKSPQKELRNTEIIESRMHSPRKNIEATEPVTVRRERLRNKFKHLLKDEETVISSSNETKDTGNGCMSHQEVKYVS